MAEPLHQPSDHSHPRVVIVDDHPTFRYGFSICELLMRSRPELAVLLASADQHDAELIERCGARGCVQKHRLLQIDFGQFWPRA